MSRVLMPTYVSFTLREKRRGTERPRQSAVTVN